MEDKIYEMKTEQLKSIEEMKTDQLKVEEQSQQIIQGLEKKIDKKIEPVSQQVAILERNWRSFEPAVFQCC